MQRFECDKCGACCKGTLIVEADDLDVLREPRLINGDPECSGKSVEQMVSEIQQQGKIVLLACGSPCSFLGTDNSCSIYTRPNACVAMQVGVEQCQDARLAVGAVVADRFNRMTGTTSSQNSRPDGTSGA